MQHNRHSTILQHGQASELPEKARSSWTPWTSPRPCSCVCYRSDSAAWTTIGPPRTNSAPQALNQLLRRHLATTLRRTQGIGFGHQRSRAGRPAHSLALCAHGRATNTTACFSRSSVGPASGESGVPLSPGSTMSRLAGASPPAASLRGLDAGKWQRGHLGPPVAALGGNPTSPLYPVRCSVGSASGHGGLPPCPGSTRLSLGVRGVVARARSGTHCVALRVYIGCCFVKWPPVAALKLRLVPPTASRPLGFTKPTLCKVPPLGTGAQPSALPGRYRVLRATVWRSHGCRGPVASVRRCARCSGQWPTAIQVVCAPAHPWGPAASRLWPRAGLPVRPPRGLPQPALHPCLPPVPTTTERNCK
jgi:hypothetical protein